MMSRIRAGARSSGAPDKENLGFLPPNRNPHPPKRFLLLLQNNLSPSPLECPLDGPLSLFPALCRQALCIIGPQSLPSTAQLPHRVFFKASFPAPLDYFSYTPPGRFAGSAPRFAADDARVALTDRRLCLEYSILSIFISVITFRCCGECQAIVQPITLFAEIVLDGQRHELMLFGSRLKFIGKSKFLDNMQIHVGYAEVRIIITSGISLEFFRVLRYVMWFSG